MNAESMTLGNRLKKLRLSKGLTQADIAEQIHVSSSCINRYERDLRKPDVGIIASLADFFDVDCDYLLGNSRKTPALEERDLVLIQKFHALDARGQSAVLNVLNHEYTLTSK